MVPRAVPSEGMKHPKHSKGFVETFSIEDIEASPIGGAMHNSTICHDFEDDYKKLFYNTNNKADEQVIVS